jgi:hypothetical protein
MVKRRKPSGKPAKKSVKRKAKASPMKEGYHLPVRSETEQLAGLSEELLDAWRSLRSLLSGLGEQRIHTSHRSIMFSRKTCYAFARPKKKHIELNFFLPEALDSELIKKVTAVSKTKHVHVLQLIHADQVDWPLTDWIRKAFDYSA